MSISSLPASSRTATILGALYRELEEEGLPADLRYEIVRDAARESTSRGICIKAPAADEQVTAGVEVDA